MLTEQFLNSCFSLVLNTSSKIKKNKTIYRDIQEILKFFIQKEKNEIPINFKTKIEFLTTFCSLKLHDKTDDNVLDSMMQGGKYNLLSDFILMKRQEILSDDVLYDHITQIRMRRKLNGVFSNYDQISKFLDTIKSGSYDSIDSVIQNYEKLIKEANFNLMESGRSVGVEACDSLDLLNDDFTPMLEMIKKKYDKENTVHTGYPIFDQDVFDNGGFEKSRLYVFGGGSGSGKSTLMLNFIANDICKPKDLSSKNTSNTYIVITLENQIDESFLRLYQILFEKETVLVLRDINNGVDIKKEVMNKIKASGYNLIFKYFPKYSISCTDISMQLDDIEDRYGKGCIRGLVVDYLDLLRSDSANELYRLELSFITAALKDIAVKYNIPVLTPTQLGRAVYRNKEASTLNLDMIGEAIKKVEHGDFICLMAKDQVDSEKVYIKVGKNRCGKDGVSIDFKVRFKHYKFIQGIVASNNKKTDATSDQLIEIDIASKNKSFGGMHEQEKIIQSCDNIF